MTSAPTETIVHDCGNAETCYCGADRPAPVRLDGCTCGGIGDTGAHRRGCAWSMSRA